MNTKLLMVIAFLFFIAWRRSADSFFLFCALFTIGLWICVLIFRGENAHTAIDEDTH